jgi:diguanylate cyclase (GGDEF)-like protein
MPWRRSDAAPRLALRFVLVTAVGLVVAGAAILTVVTHAVAELAQRQANDHARYTVGSLISSRLDRSDFRGEISRAGRAQLRRLLSSSNLGSDATGAALYHSNGEIAFTTSARSHTPDASTRERVRQALAGRLASHVSETAAGPVLSTFLPARTSNGSILGVVRLDRDYSAIATAVTRSSLKVAAILEGLLILLSLLLVPILSRSTARLRRHLEEVEHIATHDELTGLLNRHGFRRELTKATRDRTDQALVLIDLNDFRTINNTLGSKSGDAVLNTVAARLQAAAGNGCVGRVSGDEFGVLLRSNDDIETARLASVLRTALEEPIELDGLRIELEPRMGAARASKDTDADTMLRQASSALGSVQQNHQTLEIFDSRHDFRDRDRVLLAAELREALATDQFAVHYQPQADLTTRAIRGIEALIRWQHPRRGLLLPDEFLPIAEQHGLMPRIDRHVLHHSLITSHTLRNHGITLDLSVNVSPVSLLDVDFAHDLEASLDEYEFPAESLVIEITERSVLADDRQTRAALNHLAATGIRLAIDDFGTGYSSLAYLYRLPFRQVKLDKTFIANLPNDPNSDAIIHATVELSHTLKALVVAEGVETTAQWHHVRHLNCDIAQGHLIGEPQTETQLIQRLTAHPGHPTIVAA